MSRCAALITPEGPPGGFQRGQLGPVLTVGGDRHPLDLVQPGRQLAVRLAPVGAKEES
jgi:hypothetical protein